MCGGRLAEEVRQLLSGRTTQVQEEGGGAGGEEG